MCITHDQCNAFTHFFKRDVTKRKREREKDVRTGSRMSSTPDNNSELHFS